MDMNLSTWTKTRKRHLNIVTDVDTEPIIKKLHLTENSKTGFSVDFPPHLTCTPTAVCSGEAEHSASCYALSGFMSFPNAIAWHVRNQRFLESLKTKRDFQRAAENLYGDLPRSLDWLRWNGAGDLTPPAVRFINTFLDVAPDIRLWVISRKPREVSKLADKKNLKVLLSLDHSTPKKTKERLIELTKAFKRAKIRLAYTRTHEEDIPPKGVLVVFNKHGGGNRNDWKHKAVCPATLPEGPHEGACDECRRCFS